VAKIITPGPAWRELVQHVRSIHTSIEQQTEVIEDQRWAIQELSVMVEGLAKELRELRGDPPTGEK
jgi:methyl-accepting chemotaxis protein